GLATASLDGPGQGEAGFVQGIEPEFERPVGALLDALAGRADLDHGRTGIAGLGLGNLYAARAAAFEPRIAAVGTIGGPYTLVPRGERWLRKIMHSVGTDDPGQARATMARFTLEGVTSRIRQPYLVIHGKQDHGYPWQDAERKAREAPRGELVLYPEGGSVCYTVDNLAKPYLADWLREKLTG
ncbi:MAG: hypothetical protein HY511_01120, partial [Actinobacteria bacterium]|nr:hypothetical protein [Actinomycetota bacterium]